MATNSGDCKSDTAGTATLTTLSGDSAAINLDSGASNKAISKTAVILRFTLCTCLVT